MDYPLEFPPSAQARVEAARLKAIKDLTSKNQDTPAIRYVLTILSVFAHEACDLGQKGVWTAPRIETEVETFMYKLASTAESDCGEAGIIVRSLVSFGGFVRQIRGNLYNEKPPIRPTVLAAFKTSPEWKAFRDELLKVAEAQGRTETTDAPLDATPRRGYRKEVQEWMTKVGIDTVPLAAKRLGLSESALKSIMSEKGERRYSMNTLERVLKTIKVQEKGE